MHTPEQYKTLLRARGYRVTAQRLAIFQALDAAGHHQTAEEVYERVQQSVPAIALTTVYKVLHELVALGQVRRVELGDASARFDPNTSPHAHLICQRCRRTEDLPPSDYHVGLPAIAARGFQIVDQAVVFYGLCPRCQATPTDR
jgi:Fur family peroxide stress response transcriptional regulator